MIKKLFKIFGRDMLSSRRDFLALYIMIAPLLIAIGVTMLAPGLNDTTVNIALLDSDKAEHIEYLEQFTKVELFDSMDEVERRLLKRDDIAAIVQKGDGYEILLQGNEGEMVEQYAILLNTFYELDATIEETTAEMQSFGRTVPPLKKKLTNMVISMTVMLAGMLIALSIVEEKADNTVSAINVSPLSQIGFIMGKSILGIFVAVFGTIGIVLITGFYDVNWLQIILLAVSATSLSILVGFLQGINSTDVMEAAAGVKMLMLPIAGSIAGYELLADKWQWTMYWSPFYWAYKANDAVLSHTNDWGLVLFCTALVLIVSAIAFILFIPKIRKGLSH